MATTEPMDDDLFPSGPWTGFYNYTGPEDRHRMDLHLNFANGRMTGDGTDDIALFQIKGRYDQATRECWWTKTYPASHDVTYHGFREGVGIWGTWEIPPFAKGGFHIWPKRTQNSEHETLTQELEKPVEAIATTAVPEKQMSCSGNETKDNCVNSARRVVAVPPAGSPASNAT